MNINPLFQEAFKTRHIGPSNDDLPLMLETIGVGSMEELITKTIPNQIRLKKSLNLPTPLTETDYLKRAREIASKNKVFKSYIGQGYYGVTVPPVILRNIFENPGWYTQYTPYQAEISQGRLQALLNFQTMIMDLTGMEIANASLLDEATAAAEAMAMQYNVRKNKEAKTYLVSDNIFPQTMEVLKTRAIPLGVELKITDFKTSGGSQEDVFGAIVQYPAADGSIGDFRELAEDLHKNRQTLTVIADILSLSLLESPGQWGADVVVGSTQRFGIPMGFGGPHAAYFATKEIYKRNIPGRIIGVTIDTAGQYALRMALQTREQHIRRDKASSNICTAQALLAIMAGFYAVYHGAEGLKNIAGRVHGLAIILKQALSRLGYTVTNQTFFDTLSVKVDELLEPLHAEMLNQEINLLYQDQTVRISLDETTGLDDLQTLIKVFAKIKGTSMDGADLESIQQNIETCIPDALQRKDAFLTHPIFQAYHSEHEMLRYIKSLEAKDLSLCHSMIPLGSCTMKLNATTEMIPVTWPEFGNIHPFAPLDQTGGYMHLIDELDQWLCEITGFKKMSFQPNSGAQGEFTGLMVIRQYHLAQGQEQRNVALIPASAHGTNPASAAMAGMQIIVVKCDDLGNIDVEDLRQQAEKHKDNLSCLMVTYPSTHGVFEESIVEICNIIHKNGGQVYMDGANLNAQLGFTSPGSIGADVCHLNLHKTFCIPHGGGGPGMGPIGVAEHLVPFLPNHCIVETSTSDKAITAVAASPWGSASILTISHAYIALMGSDGLAKATTYAILNANYIKSRLEQHYKILYTGKNGTCAHEMIVDCREFKPMGIEVTDIAKRLMDYGFHAPTVSFPVAGTLMIEPTESESKEELDRFCDALIEIRKEIEDIINGDMDKVNNPLKNAPHTVQTVANDNWDHPYGRKKAAFPLSYVEAAKFWPSVGRVNESHGDRSLVCSCPPVEAYID